MGKCSYIKEKSACHSLAITGQLLSICHLLDSTSLPSNGETTLLINSSIFDATAESSRIVNLWAEFADLKLLFERLFCVLASSAPVERVFSQSRLVMLCRPRRALTNSCIYEVQFINTGFPTAN